jgi:hypothetical protein
MDPRRTRNRTGIKIVNVRAVRSLRKPRNIARDRLREEAGLAQAELAGFDADADRLIQLADQRRGRSGPEDPAHCQELKLTPSHHAVS